MSVAAAHHLRKPRPQRRKGVRMLQIALPSLAAAMTLGLAVQATVRALSSRVHPVAAQPLRLDNPRFSGTMNDGRAFLITAAFALRDPTDTAKLTLQAPRLVRGVGGPDASEVSSKTGEYRQDASTLVLQGDVRIANSRGSRINSERAVIDTRTGDLVDGGQVIGANANGAIKAGGYSVSDKGDRVIFKGGVRARLDAR